MGGMKTETANEREECCSHMMDGALKRARQHASAHPTRIIYLLKIILEPVVFCWRVG